MPIDYSKMFKKIFLATTATTLSVGVLSGCFNKSSSEKKSDKSASVSKNKNEDTKDKHEQEQKDKNKNEVSDTLGSEDFDDIIDSATQNPNQNLAGIIDNNKSKKRFDDLTDTLASASNRPSVSENIDDKNFVFGGDLDFNNGVASANESIPKPQEVPQQPKPEPGGNGGGTTEPEKDTEAPVLTAKQGVTVNVGDSLSVADLVEVTDNKDPNPVVTVGSYDTSKEGDIQVEVTATDASGNSSTVMVSVKVVEKDIEAPILTAKQGVTVNVGDSLSVADLVEVTDNKDSNPVVTVGSYDTSKEGDIQVEVTATDASGNSSTVMVSVKVVEKDIEAPILTAKQGVTVNVGDILNAPDLVEVTDNKDPNPVVTVGSYDTSKEGDIQVEVTATDASGNSKTATVTVVVIEKEKPEQKPE
ncbi:adhesin [Bacillus pseudomycoides]|uniref:adhesin n=1 Tax=Bacillus pseudomycoides TaxID=64104 RepID=UPI001FB21ED2|nr:adhesin [Bacillus pseudomycoides]